MAIFGFNLTLTLIGVFFLRKLIPILNLPPRFLKGFYRFLPPSEQMLRDTNNQPAKKTLGNVKKRKNQEPEKKDFVVNKNAEVPLYFAPVEPADFSFLHFYEEYCWLIDFTVATAFVCLVSLVPEEFKWTGEYLTDNFDLSIFWVSLGALFCSVTLIRLSSRYLSNANAGERSVLVMFGSINFVLCLASLSMPSTMFEVGFDEITVGLERTSKLGLIMIMAVFSALFGSCFAFPGFRTAQMSRDSAKSVPPFTKLMHHGAFYSPLLVPLLFYPKLFRNMLTDERLDENKMADWMPGAISDLTVDRIQLGFVVLTAVWRLGFWKSHLQAYIADAKNRVEKLRKRETKSTQQDIAKNITVVWYYTLVAALQYLLPSILILYLAVLWKSSSGLTFFGNESATGWSHPEGLESLPPGSFPFLIKYLIWFVSCSSAVSTIGGYAFHSICDTDL